LRLFLAPLIVSLGLAAAGCGRNGGGEVLKLTPEPNELVDNFFVVKRPAGNLAPLGGAVGTFTIRGRCLELRIGGELRTPVFMGQTGVERDGLVVRGRKIPYGAEVRLMGIGAPFRLANVANPACPAQGVFLRSIDE
jgi:hypothetical protein